MNAHYVDRDGDTWTCDPESGEYYNRHVYSGRTLDELRAEWGPLSVREEDSDRLISEEEHRTTSTLRRIIREELDRRFGPVTS